VTTMHEIAREEGFAVGLWGNAVVLHHTRTPTMADVQAIHNAICRAVIGRRTYCVLTVIGAGAGAPERSVRDAMVRSIRYGDGKIVAFGYAILGDGFSNAVSRAVVSGMLLFLKPQYPTKVFATVDAAASWLESRAHEQERVRQLTRRDALEQFCSQAVP
jgi:hypothetical protein